MQADFRSDTVTRPTQAMMQAMMQAPLGDDVLGDDPSVKLLEAYVSDLFGMEDALFCPSGTMTNQIAIKAHTQPGDELICSHLAHIYNYEGGGIAANSGVQARCGGDDLGRLTADDVKALIQPSGNVHLAATRLISVENTANKGGGSCMGLPMLEAIGQVAKSHNLAYHLDGARLFNALVRDKEDPKSYGKCFDSISLCLSKGLGAPVGSLLLGSKTFIQSGHRIRKRMGGGMRQSGLLAAAGLYALENHVEQLAEDHAKAQLIDQWLSECSWVSERKPCETNMVIFKVIDSHQASDIQERLASSGIHIVAMDSQWLRFVTHMDISDAHMAHLDKALKRL